MDHRTDCLVCGQELEYLYNRIEVECYFCREKTDTDVVCTGGHFVCDRCHAAGAMELIYKFCLRTNLTDPVEMAINLMRSRSIVMHGPEHHFLVPAVLLAAYYNTLSVLGQTTPSTRGEMEKKLREARIRSEKILGGFCGFYGACGAAIGTGIFISLVTGATPLAKQEWMLSNLMTSRSLQCIAHAGGPRCCKRDTFLALEEAVDFIKENLKVQIQLKNPTKCEFDHLNRECLKFGCQFYEGE